MGVASQPHQQEVSAHTNLFFMDITCSSPACPTTKRFPPLLFFLFFADVACSSPNCPSIKRLYLYIFILRRTFLTPRGCTYISLSYTILEVTTGPFLQLGHKVKLLPIAVLPVFRLLALTLRECTYIYLFFMDVSYSSPNHFRSHCWTFPSAWPQGKASPNFACSPPICPSTMRLHLYMFILRGYCLFFADLSAKSESSNKNKLSDKKMKFDNKRKGITGQDCEEEPLQRRFRLPTCSCSTYIVYYSLMSYSTTSSVHHFIGER